MTSFCIGQLKDVTFAAGMLQTCYHKQVLKMVMCPAIIQQEYSLAVLRQCVLPEVFFDHWHEVVKEPVFKEFCSHPCIPLTIIDDRKMCSILKTPWFLELINHKQFQLMPSIQCYQIIQHYIA
jgi:hypothetical protein